MMPIQDVYKEGAYKGLYMGLYLSLLSLFSMMSDKMPMLGLLGLLLMVGFPVMHYVLLCKAYSAHGCTASFSALWVMGITEFVGASLICALLTYGYLTVFDPDFFYRTLETMAEMLKSQPGSQDTYKMLRVAMDGGLVPSNIEYCVQMMMLTIFVGSIMTLIMIPFVKLRYRHYGEQTTV